MTTEFRLLGNVEAYVDDQLVDLGHARQRCVLVALLIDANQTVTADQLVERIWADRAPQRARDTLYGYLHRLRRILDSTEDVSITRQAGGYLLKVNPLAVDLHRFRDLVSRARAGDGDTASLPLWEQALGLWRGEAFAGLDSPWIDELRDTVDKERFAAELDHTDLRLRHGQHAGLLADLSARSARHPLDERISGQLMSALYQAGRQADALAVFQTTRHLLVEELGIDPGPQLRELHERILRGDTELARNPGDTVADPSGDVASSGLDRAVRELAMAVASQWTAEAATRSLRRPEPLRLRWSSTGRPVTADQSEHTAVRGDLTDVVAKFRQLPTRQLVVLGEPGAGKTVLAILLTLGLLADAEPNDPTPVLLALSSWNPHREHLHTWLARKLVEEYPGLANVAAYGPDAATRLVVDGRVLPVLDGLDETPPGLHAAAIDALDQAIAGGRPLVVTCRSTEYEKAVHHGGAILASAAVVEIEPVDLDDAIVFLTARQRVGDTRWRPVVAHLRQHRQGPLAQTLSTPLMVDLARTAYSGPAGEPADLLDPVRFLDRATIEQHLIDAFVPAVYGQGPPAPAPGTRPVPQSRYRPEQAQRWLTFLARHLRRRQTGDFAWWQLAQAIPPTTRGIVFGLPAALLFAITGLLVAGSTMGVVYGLSTALAGCVANGLGTRPGPLRVEVRFRGTAIRFAGRFASGLVIGLAIGFAWSLSVGVVLLLAVVFGLGLGLHVWLEVPTDANRASSPATVFAQDRVATLSFMLSVGLSLGLFYAATIAVSRPSSGLGTVGDSFYLTRALPAGLVSALFGWFAFRRLGSVSYGLAGALVGGQVMPHHTPLALGVIAGGLFGLAIGLIAAPSRSWGAYVLSRTWLALRGQAPLRLWRFLDDAHRRGVLRQSGAVYQFRHARLQNRLADTQ